MQSVQEILKDRSDDLVDNENKVWISIDTKGDNSYDTVYKLLKAIQDNARIRQGLEPLP